MLTALICKEYESIKGNVSAEEELHAKKLVKERKEKSKKHNSSTNASNKNDSSESIANNSPKIIEDSNEASSVEDVSSQHAATKDAFVLESESEEDSAMDLISQLVNDEMTEQEVLGLIGVIVEKDEILKAIGKSSKGQNKTNFKKLTNLTLKIRNIDTTIQEEEASAVEDEQEDATADSAVLYGGADLDAIGAMADAVLTQCEEK